MLFADLRLGEVFLYGEERPGESKHYALSNRPFTFEAIALARVGVRQPLIDSPGEAAMSTHIVRRAIEFIGLISACAALLALTAQWAEATTRTETRGANAISPPAAMRSCDEVGLNAALTAGGLNTFSCAVATTITITNTKTVSSSGTSLDGGGLLTINGNHARRVFVVNAGVAATFQNLAITNGLAYEGGGIDSHGTTTISHCTLSGNGAYFAGGGVSSSGLLTIRDSVFDDNGAVYGGGIWNGGGGTLIIINSTLSNNSVTCYGATCSALGGGIENDVGCTMTISNSTLSGNSAQCSGGAYCEAGGGGLFSYSKATISDSTLSANTTFCDVDGCFAIGGGIYLTGTVTITNSTLTSNSATCSGTCSATGGGAATGGFFNAVPNYMAGAITMTNSTLYGNGVACSGTSCIGGGGGLENYFHGRVTLINSTLSGNTVTCSGSSCSTAGGGIDNQSTSTLNYANTIIANSTGADCSAYYGSTIGTNTNNLVEDNTCSPFRSGDPRLGSLANNGGPTKTMALLVGSAAIDAASDASCPTKDQRGWRRPFGLHCDIGAYERGVFVLMPIIFR